MRIKLTNKSYPQEAAQWLIRQAVTMNYKQVSWQNQREKNQWFCLHISSMENMVAWTDNIEQYDLFDKLLCGTMLSKKKKKKLTHIVQPIVWKNKLKNWKLYWMDFVLLLWAITKEHAWRLHKENLLKHARETSFQSNNENAWENLLKHTWETIVSNKIMKIPLEKFLKNARETTVSNEILYTNPKLGAICLFHGLLSQKLCFMNYLYKIILI